MGSYSFQMCWLVSLVVLLTLAALVGKAIKQGILGIFIDGRGRYSLTHFQVALWTIVVLSSALGVLISNGFDPKAVQLSPQLLGLMGISVGSGVLATGVKATKDTPASTANVARAGSFTLSDGTTTTIAPH